MASGEKTGRSFAGTFWRKEILQQWKNLEDEILEEEEEEDTKVEVDTKRKARKRKKPSLQSWKLRVCVPRPRVDISAATFSRFSFQQLRLDKLDKYSER